MTDERRKAPPIAPGSSVTTIAGNAATVLRLHPELPECVVERTSDGELVSHTLKHVTRREA